MEQFSKGELKIPDLIDDRCGVERASCTVFARYFCMRYIKDAGYLPGNETTDKVNELQPRWNHVSFVKMLSP